jgi:hypothetical protein
VSGRFALSALTIVSTFPAAPAEARRARAAATIETRAPLAKPKPVVTAPPLLAVVSLADQRISVYGPDGRIAESPISSGQAGHRTPTGVFSIIQRNRYHESNLYSNAPMPFMQRLTWSGIALHEGHLPGYPASHGCIRLPTTFAQQLWGMTRLGTRVIVAPREAAVTDFAHDTLPKPAIGPEAPAAVAQDKVEEPKRALGLATAVRNGGLSWVTLTSAAEAAPPSRVTDGRRTPLDRARAAQMAALAERTEAERAWREAVAEANAVSQKATEHAAIVRETYPLLRAARDQLARATTDEERAHRARHLFDAEDEIDAERRAAREFDAAAFAAAERANVAQRRIETAETALKDAMRRTEPITVFVSRDDRMAYVRQGHETIYEAPVTIVEDWLPIGTHVIEAARVGVDGGDLAWRLVTVPETSIEPEPAGRNARAQPDDAIAQRARNHRETATGALDRIRLPDDLRAFIAERLWVGATLMLSDHPISRETGRGTDFVILTR